MNKLTLITAASAVAFFSATQAAVADSHTQATASTSHVSLDLEGFYGRSSTMGSDLKVNNVTNAASPVTSATSPGDLNADSQWGWAANLGYTFDNGSAIDFSYRGIKEKNNKTRTYQSISQLIADDAQTYNVNVNLTSTGAGTTSIGVDTNGTGNTAYAILSATDTLVETGELHYQQANLDWGKSFKVTHGLSFHPYLGLAWRGVSYKNSMTFSSLGNYSGAAPTASSDFFVNGALAGGGTISVGSASDPDAAADADAGIYAVTEITGGGNIVNDSAASAINTTAATDTFTIYQNDASDVSTDDDYIGSHLPTYTSKFSGFGLRFGVSGQYAFGEHFALTGGLDLAVPYGTLKVSGNTTLFKTEDLQTSGAVTTASTSGTLKQNVNLKINDSSPSTTISVAKEHLFIPEIEANFGLRLANDITAEGDMTYYLEGGYRVINDWSAVKTIDTSASTFAEAANVVQQNVASFGPYLKAGVTFGT